MSAGIVVVTGGSAGVGRAVKGACRLAALGIEGNQSGPGGGPVAGHPVSICR